MFKAAYNPTDSPAPADDEGRIIGGGDWGVVDTTSDAGSASIDRGSIVVSDVEGDDLQREAVAARDEAERRQRLSGLSRDEAAKLAKSEGLELEDGAAKAELFSSLVRSGADVKSAPKKTTTDDAPSTSSQGG